MLRSHLELGVLPWTHAAISGWILDPDRKKMSKSKGNVVTPMDLLHRARLGRGALLGRAARGPGTDTTFDTGQIKIGRRLATKLLNASKFVLGLAGLATQDPEPPAETAPATETAPRPRPRRDRRPRPVTEPVDRALLTRLATVVTRKPPRPSTSYDYTRALELTEDVLLVLLRRLPGTGQDRGPTAKAGPRPRRRVGPSHPGARAVGASCGCSRRSCRS